MSGSKGFVDMAVLAVGYIVVTALVQGSRFIKRFYVRRFANNVDRSMKRTLYANLTHKSGPELAKEGSGNLLTKAISDVGDCAGRNAANSRPRCSTPASRWSDT